MITNEDAYKYLSLSIDVYGKELEYHPIPYYIPKGAVIYEKVCKNADWAMWIENGVMYSGDKGTDTVNDWLKDFNFVEFEMPIKGGDIYDIHSGFLSVALQKDEFEREFIARNKPQKIVRFGHSLGGAVCQISALLTHDLVPCQDVVGFDAPKPFDKKSAEMFCRLPYINTRLIALEGDNVHFLPPQNHTPVDVEHIKPFEWWAGIAANPLIALFNQTWNKNAHPHHPLRLLDAMKVKYKIK